jgi:aerobic carbon-monoxide dehydrogenase small subunit
MKAINTRINGKPVALEVADHRLHLDLLREDLKLTGTKESCGVGVCGACTVLLDGKPVSACLLLAVYVDECEITTIEGLVDGGELHPLQRAFIKHGGYQCGICTPGQILAAKALLDCNPRPSRAEIQRWMMGNLCRCTGYYKILESIEAAAGEPTL